ncbi:unnamed protein product, partial [Heligmosomoides polygyrus]|uniref:Reverse transcriptase n=1 Tax=Heligmosomoides polygyrus TaxID=6339 RepID=A0A183GWF1_HELPZ
MKLGKAAGPDGVPVEAWKVLGDLWLTQFNQLADAVLQQDHDRRRPSLNDPLRGRDRPSSRQPGGAGGEGAVVAERPRDNGLRLNVKKTKFISSEQCAGSILDCQREAIEKVEEYRYLGSDLSEEGSLDQA